MAAYEWKCGFKANVKAEDAGKVFEELEATEEGLTAKSLVKASRSKDAPLHKAFEWDNKIAGEKWREQQARVLINHLVIRREDVEEVEPVRAFVTISQESSNYENIHSVLRDSVKSTSYFEMGMKMLNDFKRRFGDMQEFAEVIAEIDKLGGGNEGIN